MIDQTTAIVLHQIRYSESSLIIKLYTYDFGIQSYIVKGVRSSQRKKNHAALFQPLSQLQFTFRKNKRSPLSLFLEGKATPSYQTLHTNPLKISVVFFLSELLSQVLHEEESNPSQYEFLSQSLQFFDNEPDKFANFHLWFMLHLTKYLGFFPNIHSFDANHLYLDKKEGHYVSQENENTFSAEISHLFSIFLSQNLTDALKVNMNQNLRNKFLADIIALYQLHHYDISRIKSFKVLEEMMKVY